MCTEILQCSNDQWNLFPLANYVSAGNGGPPNSKVNKYIQQSSRAQTLREKCGCYCTSAVWQYFSLFLRQNRSEDLPNKS